jgi:RHS repeat-associated protein
MLITGTTTNPFIFDGLDGLYRDLPNWMQVRARFLDTVKGRWPSRDPIGSADDWDAYRFVGNNPVIWIDPSGYRCSGAGVDEPGSCDDDDIAECKAECKKKKEIYVECACVLAADIMFCEIYVRACICKPRLTNKECSTIRDACNAEGWFIEGYYGGCWHCWRYCKEYGEWPYDKCHIWPETA